MVPFIAALALGGCGSTESKKDDSTKTGSARVTTSLPVRVVQVGSGKVVETLSVQGRLEVWQRVILSPKVTGVIGEITVLANQQVTKDQPILRLQAPLADVEALAKATSKLEQAQRDLDRRVKLREIAPETLSLADLDIARDLVTDSRLEVEIYRQREASRVMTAPFAGVLLMPPSTAAANSQPVIVGQQVSEGTQVAELLDTSRFRLSLDLPEPNLRRLALGQTVAITPIADSVAGKGTISALPEAIDPLKGSGRVYVDVTLPPKSWRPGGFVSAQLVLGETEAPLVLPRDSVLYRENRPYAWVAEEHEGALVTRRAWLDLGPGDDRSLVVTKGVAAGDRVVTEGQSGLSDGVPVSIREAETAAVPDEVKEKAK